MKHTHIGVYGLLKENGKILLIKKANGPYKGKLDLPGGSLIFGETPEKALIREFKEETGLDILEYKINNSNSVVVNWVYDGKDTTTHHIGIFYDILKYKGNIKEKVLIDEINDDSLGASFYELDKLTENDLSLITALNITN